MAFRWCLSHLDLFASGREEVLLELGERDDAIAVGIEGVEHRLVHLHIRAAALLEANGAEGALELAQAENAIAIGVKLRKDVGQVPLVRLRRWGEEPGAGVQAAAREGIVHGRGLAEHGHLLGRNRSGLQCSSVKSHALSGRVISLLHKSGRTVQMSKQVM